MSDDSQTSKSFRAELPVGSSYLGVTRLPGGSIINVNRGPGTIAPPPVLTRRKSRRASTGHPILPIFHLLTRRVSDPSTEVPGFPDHYYCPNCREFFVLAWHPAYSPFVRDCAVVPETNPRMLGKDPRMIAVFCPKCGTSRRIYGNIPHPDASVFQPDETFVLRRYDCTLHPGIPLGFAAKPLPDGPRIEKVVLCVTGEIPKGLVVSELADSLVVANVYPMFRSGFRVSGKGGACLHVFQINKLVNRSDWLISLVKRECFPAAGCGGKIFAKTDTIALEPPLGEAVFCMIFTGHPVRTESRTSRSVRKFESSKFMGHFRRSEGTVTG